MTVAIATPAVVRRRPRPCVRCGEAPRSGDTYLCGECHVSPAMRAEIDAAQAADPNHPRFELIKVGWKGGWTRHEAGQPV